MSFKITIPFLFMCCLTAKLQAQNTMQRSMIQYLYPDFSQSVVMMKNGEKKTSVMNFNTVTEKMVFISNGKYYDLMNPEIIDTVYLNNKKFVSAGKVFYEMLLSGTIALFIEHKGDLVDKGTPVGYGGTSQLAKSVYLTSYDAVGGTYNLELPENFEVKPAPVYWIRRNGEMLSFTNQKQYLLLFPDKADAIRSFIKEFRLKFNSEQDLVKIVRYSGNI
jgi:hypothetical protein